MLDSQPQRAGRREFGGLKRSVQCSQDRALSLKSHFVRQNDGVSNATAAYMGLYGSEDSIENIQIIATSMLSIIR